MIWRNLTSKEIASLDKSIPVILPIGAIEQHGPHLNVETDTLIGEFFCNLLNEKMKPEVIVLPSIAICCSEHHMDFAGTLSVSHDTLMRYVKDILVSIVANGFKNIIIFNAHGGNQAIASVIVESFGVENRGVNIAVMTWWKIASKELLEISDTGPFGVGHACELETSLMLYIKGDNVRTDEVVNGPVNKTFDWAGADLLRGSKALLYRSMKEHTPNGVYGDPREATVEKGQQITTVVMKNFIKIVKDMKI